MKLGVLLVAMLALVACRRSEPVRADHVPDAQPRVAEASVDAAPTLADLYGRFGEELEKLPFKDLPVAVLGPTATATPPSRVGFVEHPEHGRVLAILGPVMWISTEGEEVRAQIYDARAKDGPLRVKTARATQWTTFRAIWDRSPTPTLLAVLDAAGEPIAVRDLGAVWKVEEVSLFDGEPTFFAFELGSHSGVDDNIGLSILRLHDGALQTVAKFDLGMRDTSPCDDGGVCELGPPGSVAIVGTKPPRLRLRLPTKPHTPADVATGFSGIERFDVWDEKTGKLVAGAARPFLFPPMSPRVLPP
jgi:hypothetical protein